MNNAPHDKATTEPIAIDKNTKTGKKKLNPLLVPCILLALALVASLSFIAIDNSKTKNQQHKESTEPSALESHAQATPDDKPDAKPVEKPNKQPASKPSTTQSAIQFPPAPDKQIDYMGKGINYTVIPMRSAYPSEGYLYSATVDENDTKLLHVTFNKNAFADNPGPDPNERASLTLRAPAAILETATIQHRDVGHSIYVLLEDGTVAYTSSYDYASKGNLDFKRVDGITDAIMFKKALIQGDGDHNNDFCYIVYRADGTYYVI